MAKFEIGNKMARGGRREPPGGRPSNLEKEINRRAEELATEYIERNIIPVLETYGKVAKGYTVHKVITTKSGSVIEWDEFVYDSNILRHYMDRVKPPRAPENRRGDVPPAVYIHPNLEADDDDTPRMIEDHTADKKTGLH